jgi:hypothetical protein
VKQIQDRIKPDPVIKLHERVSWKVKQIQDMIKPDPVINFMNV